MRHLCAVALMVTLTLVAPDSHADERDPALALFSGASVFLASFAVGAVLLGTSDASDTQNNVGWLTMETGFAVAPWVSHAVVGEWARALVFSAPPVATLGGTGALLASDHAAIAHGELAEQRVLWALFGTGLFSSAVGIVDATLSDQRARTIAAAPMVGAGQVGLLLRGTL